nr:hypothetical protein GCM10020093_021150 [Planobispora longispora]
MACGVRINTGAAYLLGIISRPNLAVHGDCTVRSIVLRRGPGGLRATGVLAVRDGHAEVIEAGRVIVCAGAFGSAHLLQVSGIGPAEVLTAAGIQVVHDLPAIGAAFSDHPQVVVEWVPNRTLPEPEDSWLGGALHLGSGRRAWRPGDPSVARAYGGTRQGPDHGAGAPHAFLVSVQTPGRSAGCARSRPTWTLHPASATAIWPNRKIADGCAKRSGRQRRSWDRPRSPS